VIVITVALRILIMQILTIHQGSGGGGANRLMRWVYGEDTMWEYKLQHQ